MATPREELKEALDEMTLRIIHRSMGGFWRYAKSQGLSMTQMIAMRQIYHRGEGEGCSISDISENLGVTNAAISQSLEKLVQMGLVSREENPRDRRSKQIFLTPRGEKILEESARSRHAWIREAVKKLSPEDAARVADALRLLLETWDEISQSS